MVQYLILVTVKDPDLFARYLAGHLPTLERFGGKIVFRSTENSPVLGFENVDIVVIQEWQSVSDFERWWNSEEYKPWADIRENAAAMTIIQCHNRVPA